MDNHRRGTHKGIKLITQIDHSTASVVAELLAMGIEIKHLSDLHAIEFVVSDTALLDIAHDRVREELLIENDPKLVRDYVHKFEHLWISGIDARKRLSELKANGS